MIELPIKPISINQCFQGRRFRTKEFKQWQNDMLKVMPKRSKLAGGVKVAITLFLKSIYRSDCDNFLKPIIDCIVKRGWITDDRFIQYLEVAKVKSKVEKIGIEIGTL